MWLVTNSAPKNGKVYRGKKRLAKKLIGSKWKTLRWAATKKPGDYIYSLEGCNRQIKRIKYIWRNEGLLRRDKPGKTWVIGDIIFYDNAGNAHSSAWRDSLEPRSNKEINESWLKILQTLNTNCLGLDNDKEIDIVKSNRLLDGHGEFINGTLSLSVYGD